jgi:hypothetical protein
MQDNVQGWRSRLQQGIWSGIEVMRVPKLARTIRRKVLPRARAVTAHYSLDATTQKRQNIKEVLSRCGSAYLDYAAAGSRSIVQKATCFEEYPPATRPVFADCPFRQGLHFPEQHMNPIKVVTDQRCLD